MFLRGDIMDASDMSHLLKRHPTLRLVDHENATYYRERVPKLQRSIVDGSMESPSMASASISSGGSVNSDRPSDAGSVPAAAAESNWRIAITPAVVPAPQGPIEGAEALGSDFRMPEGWCSMERSTQDFIWDYHNWWSPESVVLPASLIEGTIRRHL